MSAQNCPNCGNPIGCSCSGGSQVKTASDGKQVCSKCISQYETYIAMLQTVKSSKTN